MEPTGINLSSRKRTPLDMFHEGVARHKERFHGLPYRVTLSADWRETMQEATALVVEGQEVLVSYRRGQHYQTVTTQHEKRTNQPRK